MVEPFLMSIAFSYFAKHAPDWLQTLKETLLGKGKDLAKQRWTDLLNERQQQRHMELALKNAAERGLKSFQTLQERDQYRQIITILAEPGSHSDALRRQALQLFTLSDTPDLKELNEMYNRSLSIRSLSDPTPPEPVDATPYLKSFFEALLAELYKDSFFHSQISEEIQARSALNLQRSLPDILTTLHQMRDIFANDYSAEQFEQDFVKYTSHIEWSLRYLKLAGVVPKGVGQDYKDPELSGMFVPLSLEPLASTFWGNYQDSGSSVIKVLQQTPCVVILGGPGSGKSTLTRHLAWSHAFWHAFHNHSKQLKIELLPEYPFPLHIELRLFSDVRHLHPEYDFLAYTINVLLGGAGVHVDRRLFEMLLERRGMLILFDGLDEVATLQERRRLVEDIESFIQEYPGNRVIVTSRPVGYEQAACTRLWFNHMEIQLLNDEQIHQFLENWYICVLRLDPIQPVDRQELENLSETLKENTRLHTLAENPLLLSVITALHRFERLPDRRVLVYDRCADLLLDTWARLKGTDKRWQDLILSREDQSMCVAHLGFFLHRRSQESQQDQIQISDVSAKVLSRELDHFLESQELFSSKAEQHLQAQRFFELMQVEAGLIVERGTDEQGEPLYGFVHRTFQEYFAAADINERYLQEENSSIVTQFLIEHLHDPHWREVILLLLSKLKRKPVTQQLQAIFEGKTLSNRSDHTKLIQQDLFFLGICLAEEIAVDIALARRVVAQISHLVKFSPFITQRIEAIEILYSLLKTRQYALLVYEALLTLIKENAIVHFLKRIETIYLLYQNNAVSIEEKQWLSTELFTLAREAHVPINLLIEAAFNLYQRSFLMPEIKPLASQFFSILAQRSDLSAEQLINVARNLYQKNLPSPEERRFATQLLCALAQRSDLSAEQLINVAQVLYQRNLPDSEEGRFATQLLCALAQRSDLSAEQLINVAQDLYRRSLPGSEEEKLATQLLCALAQRSDLSAEQLINVARNLYESSVPDSEEGRVAVQLLLTLAQRSDLPIAQLIRVAQVLYESSSSDFEAERFAIQFLLTLAQRPDLSIEQLIRVAQVLYESSVPDSEEGRVAVQLLLTLAQRSDLPIAQLIRVAQALYESSTPNSEAERFSMQLLLTLAQRADLWVERFINVVRDLYESSTPNSEAERFSTQLLLTLAQRADLSVEQFINVVRDLYESSTPNSEAERFSMQLLLTLAQRADLSVEQLIDVARHLYESSASGSEEEKLATQLLLTLAQRADLSVEQLISSSSDFDEGRLATQLLLTLAQRADLSVEQLIDVAQHLYESSASGFEEEKLATQLLLTLAQRADLSVEQLIETAHALYGSSASGSEEEKLATQLLLTLAQRADLSVEQLIDVARHLYESSASGSEEEKLATQLLLTLAQRADLSVEQLKQLIETAQALYGNSSSGSEEEKLATQLLLTLAQRADLSIEQLIETAHALYERISSNSEAERSITQLLFSQVQNMNVLHTQKLKVLEIFFASDSISFANRVRAVDLTLQLLPEEQAKQYLSQYRLISNNLSVSDVKYLVRLAQQELLPPEVRDEAYQKLKTMAPYFLKDDIEC